MAFADPEKNISQFSLQPGMVAADFGTGDGAYAVGMSKRVMPGGKVYAIDVQKELLIRLKNSCQQKHITNVDFIWGDVENIGGTKIADNTVDLVLISNILFQIKGGFTLATEAKRILKPGGRVAVIDWTDSFGGMGPQPADVVNEDDARKIFEQTGLIYDRSFVAGDHHYGIILIKK